MNDFNNAELLAGLLKRADSGEHSRFEYIRSIKAYFAARTARSAVKKLVANFARSEDKLFKEHCTCVMKGDLSAERLLASVEVGNAALFFQEEYEILDSMIQEYHAYLTAGHLFYSLNFGYREFKDLWDHRKPKPENQNTVW